MLGPGSAERAARLEKHFPPARRFHIPRLIALHGLSALSAFLREKIKCTWSPFSRQYYSPEWTQEMGMINFKGY